VHAQNNLKRRRDEDKSEIERRKRKKDHFLFSYQMKWSLATIKERYENVKENRWLLGDGMREEVKRVTFHRGDQTHHLVQDELEEDVEELDENNPYFGLSKGEIEELKRLEEEEKALERLEKGQKREEDDEDYEGAKALPPPVSEKPVKGNSRLQNDLLDDEEIARLDELELAKIEAEQKAIKGAKLDEDEDEELRKLEEEEAMMKEEEERDKREAKKVKKVQEKAEDDEDDELRKLEEEEARMKEKELDEDEDLLIKREEEELKKLEAEEAELMKLEEEAVLKKL